MDVDNIVNIKQEKSHDGYDITVNNKAKAVPKPITVKQEETEINDVNDSNSNNMNTKEGKQNDVKILAENSFEKNGEENRGITPPRPIIIRKKSPEMDSDKNMVDDLSFLDDLNDDIDDIIPIVNETPVINIDDDMEGELEVYKETKVNKEESKRGMKREKYDNEEGELKPKKRKKKSKKRKSHSPVDVKPNLKKLNESLGLPNELSDISADEMFNSNDNDNENRFPRKVYNYNHSSVPTVLENIEKETIQSISNSVKVKQERQDFSSKEKLKIKVRPPLPKKIKLEKENLNENNIDEVLKMCSKALKHLKVYKSKSNFHRFLYTPTKIIVPISTEEKEYQSPLLRSSQISFNYSSTNPKIQYNKFNLECPSEKITHVSKPLGLDVSKLKDWIESFGRNSYIKNKKDNKKPFESGNEIVNLTTIHTSISTQTIDIPCNICLLRQLRSNNHIGVMAKMEGNEISTQTDEQKNELPILRILESLNANQLLAINDFTMLLCEQNWDSADASSRLIIRDKILQYFQEGQKPCNAPGIRTSSQLAHNQLKISASTTSQIINSQNRSMINANYQPPTNNAISGLPVNPMYKNNNNTVGGVLVNTMYNNSTLVPPATQMGQYQFNPAIQMTNQRVFPPGVMENIGAIQQSINHRNLNIPLESRPNDPRLNRMDPRYRH